MTEGTPMRQTALALSLALALTATAAPADTYPSRVVKMIVPFPAGGTTDIFARHIGDQLAKAFGHNFVIDNRGGAGGNIGSDAVAKADPDGYTLLVGTVGTHAINSSLYARMTFDPVRDFAPVAFLAGVPNILVVNPKNMKATTVQDFIAEAKASPKKLSFASSGNGTSIHLSGEMFKQMTGVELVHVPYRGSAPAVNNLIAGQVDLMFDNLPSSIEQVRGGNLRAIAVTSAKRSAACRTCRRSPSRGCRASTPRAGLRSSRRQRPRPRSSEAQRRGAEGARRPRAAEALRRHRRRDPAVQARRARRLRQGRDREMGQGREDLGAKIE